MIYYPIAVFHLSPSIPSVVLAHKCAHYAVDQTARVLLVALRCSVKHACLRLKVYFLLFQYAPWSVNILISAVPVVVISPWR